LQSTAIGLLLASSVVGIPGSSKLSNFARQAEPQMVMTETRTASKNGMSAEEYVKNYFSDVPIMIEIAKCESRFRQFDKNGDVLRGEKNRLDRGVMQINEFYHSESSDKLGFDIMTIEGNTAYARYLFEKFGVKPWSSSSKCWAKTIAYSEYVNSV